MGGEDHEEWSSTGAHAYRCERAGIVFLRISGDIGEEHIATFFQAFGRCCDEVATPHVFWLVDLAGMGSMLPDARKLAASTPVRPENKGMAIFGASFAQRVLVTLVDKATSLLHPGSPPLAFHDSEADARAWIARRRSKLGPDGAVTPGGR